MGLFGDRHRLIGSYWCVFTNGILVCRYHHLLWHNNHWEIVRTGIDYWLIPPADVDPTQKPRLMPSKCAALRDLLRQKAARESA